MHDVIAIGGSAGAVAPLQIIAQGLPRELQAMVFIVMHRAISWGVDALPGLLQRRCPLPVEPAVDGVSPVRGRVYVGPANAHFRVVEGCIRTGETLPTSPNRGSIDAMFRSVSAAYRSRVIGVVLSGALHDGTHGLAEIRGAGGIAIAQDPSEADFPSMPAHAMHEVSVHYCLPASEIARTVVDIVSGAVVQPTRPRVLIVEDEYLLAHELEHQLAGLGYDVVGLVQSGEQALRIAPDLPIDVVVMDIRLAGALRGTQAARALWTQHRIPAVFVTAYSDENTIREASVGSAGFLVKPVRAPQLHAAIQLALDRHTSPLFPI